eukprot:jgi/Galph1/2849/GphlegSOOS_G1518.1
MIRASFRFWWKSCFLLSIIWFAFLYLYKTLSLLGVLIVLAYSYVTFYRLVIPPTLFRFPLYFDFTAKYPVAVAFVPETWRHMRKLDGVLHLCFPESPRNMEAGMIKISVELSTEKGQVSYSNYRPTVLRYKDQTLTKIETLTFSIPLLFGFMKQQQCQDITVLEHHMDRKDFAKSKNWQLKVFLDKNNLEVLLSAV